MKRLIILVTLIFASLGAAAQTTIVINSEKVFKSIPAYTEAMTRLDKMAEQYQNEVQQKFTAVEMLFNQYQAHKAELSKAKSAEYEQAILLKEREAQEFQESVFGKDGILMQQRVELIQPIQKQVFAALDRYAAEVGADVVIDSSNNPTLLFNAQRVEHTERLIQYMKK